MKSEAGVSTHPPAVTRFEIRGEEFVLLPRKEYDRLRGLPSDAVDAVSFGMRSLGRNLRRAREQAGLTQAELGEKLRRSQSLVSSAENGTVRVGQRYVLAVLAACGLAENWKPASPSKRASTRRKPSARRTPRPVR